MCVVRAWRLRGQRWEFSETWETGSEPERVLSYDVRGPDEGIQRLRVIGILEEKLGFVE